VSAQYGVWCVTDGAWCQDTVGTQEHAYVELPHWQSGERANVDASRFVYAVREVDPVRPYTFVPPVARHLSAEVRRLRSELDALEKAVGK